MSYISSLFPQNWINYHLTCAEQVMDLNSDRKQTACKCYRTVL